MKMIDLDTEKEIKDLGLFLTVKQANQLIGYLEGFIEIYGKQGQHIHLSDTSHTREITIALYDDKDLSKFSFDQLAMKLLRDEL
jgi:hypothetical protein